MEMRLIIQQQRKALGLTQEQVANYLGVTTPAVNKWEKGSTCPDIALLSPLARLLRIDLNTLLGFYEELSMQETVRLCREIHALVLEEGFDAGYTLALEKIREYPNSDKLLHTLALQLQGLLITAALNEEQYNKYMQIIAEWYARLSRSNDSVIRNSALFMLASQAIKNAQFSKAQEYLDELPNRCDTPDKRMLQATVYLHQSRAEEAIQLMEATLLAAAGDVQTILYKLIGSNIAAGDDKTAAYVAERAARFADALDLNPCNASIAGLELSAARLDADQSVQQLRKILESLSAPWRPQNSPLYHLLPSSAPSSSMDKMISPLLESIKQESAYAYLHSNEDFLALLAEFETGTGSS